MHFVPHTVGRKLSTRVYIYVFYVLTDFSLLSLNVYFVIYYIGTPLNDHVLVFCLKTHKRRIIYIVIFIS